MKQNKDSMSITRRDLMGAELKPDVVIRLQHQFVMACMRDDVYSELDAMAKLQVGTVHTTRSDDQ